VVTGSTLPTEGDSHRQRKPRPDAPRYQDSMPRRNALHAVLEDAVLDVIADEVRDTDRQARQQGRSCGGINPSARKRSCQIRH